MTESSFKKLIVWQKSYELTKEVYVLCEQLPKSETYGLASQMQRCALSIPSNIAEGHQRNGSAEFRQFLGIARGSAAELETQLMLAHDIYKMDVEPSLAKLVEVQKLLNAFISKLR